MLNYLKLKYENFRKSDTERYLDASVDRSDFESRLQKVENGLTYPYRMLPLYFS